MLSLVRNALFTRYSDCRVPTRSDCSSLSLLKFLHESLHLDRDSDTGVPVPPADAARLQLLSKDAHTDERDIVRDPLYSGDYRLRAGGRRSAPEEIVKRHQTL